MSSATADDKGAKQQEYPVKGYIPSLFDEMINED
jgi:hypothetical protein